MENNNLKEEEKAGSALRFDNGKIQHELISPNSANELAKVLTFGASKYAANNWRKGMKWSRVLGSLKRHLNAIERGEDYDEESGLLHSSHILCNAMFLTDYYKLYPEGDDRQHSYLNDKKIGLDIDGVIADFHLHFCNYLNIPIYEPIHWNDPIIRNKFNEVREDEKFWLTMPKLDTEIPFEPHCYITSRSINPVITQQWLEKNGFPIAPLYCVGHNESKVAIAKESGVEIFVDDKYENFTELNKSGICCFLYDAPHNKKYNVGYKRIFNLNSLI